MKSCFLFKKLFSYKESSNNEKKGYNDLNYGNKIIHSKSLPLIISISKSPQSKGTAFNFQKQKEIIYNTLKFKSYAPKESLLFKNKLLRSSPMVINKLTKTQRKSKSQFPLQSLLSNSYITIDALSKDKHFIPNPLIYFSRAKEQNSLSRQEKRMVQGSKSASLYTDKPKQYHNQVIKI